MTNGTEIRLQKYLARAGVAARRKVEELISSGAVQVNGVVVKEPFHRINLGVDEVRCEGQLLQPAKAVYYKLYKPTGVLSAMGEAEVPTLEALLPPEMSRVFPVGRLDFDASGLILLTNDGDLGNLLLHPSHHVEKRYEVRLKPCPGRSQLQRLAAGIVLDGKPTKPSTWEIMGRSQGGQCVVTVTLTEGRKNQLKRMANSIGSEVKALERVAFGPIQLGHMKPGTLKKLAPGEVTALKAAAAKVATLAGISGADDDDEDDG